MVNVITNWIISDLNNEKLTDLNYDIWSRKVQLLLEDQELLEPLTHNMEPPTSREENTDMIQYRKDLEAYNAWKKKSRAARMILLISMRNDLMLRFDCHQTAKEVWDAVKGSFDMTPLVRMRQMQLCFDNYKMKTNHTIAEHIATMSDMIHELAAAGYVLTDEQQVQAMIRSIPDDQTWDLIKKKIIYDVNIQNFESVARNLMLEEEKIDFKKPLHGARELQLESPPVQNGAKKKRRAQENQPGCNDQKENECSVGKNKKAKLENSNDCPKVCYICKKTGHFAKACPKVCFNCQQRGHLAQNCPLENLAQNCPEENSKDCPKVCYICQKNGHLARDCPKVCFNCQQRGHLAQNCPAEKVLIPAKKSEIHVAWTKPDKGWIKVNTDGAVRDRQGLAATAGAMRDDNGLWLGGFVQNMDNCSVQMAELQGVLHGLQLAWDRGFRQVIVETDNESCCTLLDQDADPNHPLFNMVQQCKELLLRDWNIQYRHIYREANKLADYICSIAFSFPVGFHVLNELPYGAIPFIFDDINGVATPRMVSM